MKVSGISAAFFLSSLAFLVLLTIIGEGWTWSLYDELAWIHYFKRPGGLLEYVQNDFIQNGRVKVLSATWVFAKFSAFGLSPHILRIVRVFEWIAMAGISYFYLHRIRKMTPLVAVFGLAFALKSPPVLEQLRWMTLAEIQGITLVILSLIIQERAALLKYLPLIIAVMFKETFILFLPLPAFLQKKWREVFLSGLASMAYFLFLMANRKGYTGSYGFHQVYLKLNDLAVGLFKDWILALPVLGYVCYKQRPTLSAGYIQQSNVWQAISFFCVSSVYFLFVSPMANTYNYMFAPALFFGGLAIAFFLQSYLDKAQYFAKLMEVYLLLAIIAFSFRIDWNWSRSYDRMAQQTEMITSILNTGYKGLVGTNCPADLKDINFAMSLTAGEPYLERENGPFCADLNQPLESCCQNDVEYMVLGSDCWNTPERVQQARNKGLKEIFKNNGWYVFSCR